MEIRDDSALIAIVIKEPEKGFRLLMEKYNNVVYWHIRRLVVLHDDAQDATQETFVRIFCSLNKFIYKDQFSFRSWIFRIATNEALRIMSKRNNRRVSIDDSAVEIDSIVADEYVDLSDLEAVKLQHAILVLPTKQQLAFNLRYYNELSYDEIAEIIDSTSDSVKSNYHIAKGKDNQIYEL